MKRQKFSRKFEIIESDAPMTDKGSNKRISVERNGEKRDFRRAVNRIKPPKTFAPKPRTTNRKTLKPFACDSVTESGQSSNSKADQEPRFLCEICAEPRNPNQSFNINGCSHVYCTDCVIKYIGSKLQENVTVINCPDPNCNKGSLEPEGCRAILPKEVYERWGDALCQAMILGFKRFYCPFKDCSMVLILDGEQQGVEESECPYCNRLFCAQCGVPWHSEVDCEEFQRLHKDEREREDILLMKLAKDKKWGRCPTCRFVIEKTQGCRYITCRCGTAFCYKCSSTRVDNLHYCHDCRA